MSEVAMAVIIIEEKILCYVHSSESSQNSDKHDCAVITFNAIFWIKNFIIKFLTPSILA